MPAIILRKHSHPTLVLKDRLGSSGFASIFGMSASVQTPSSSTRCRGGVAARFLRWSMGTIESNETSRAWPAPTTPHWRPCLEERAMPAIILRKHSHPTPTEPCHPSPVFSRFCLLYEIRNRTRTYLFTHPILLDLTQQGGITDFQQFSRLRLVASGGLKGPADQRGFHDLLRLLDGKTAKKIIQPPSG